MVETIRFKKPPISYDSRDYEAVRDDLIRSIPFFTPEWTDHNPTDFGIVLIELFAISADVLHFYVDRALFEGFWGTAITRDSMARLGKLIDFELRAAVAASVDLVFTLPSVLPGTLLIPKGTLVQTTGTDPVSFETIADLNIPTPDLEGTVAAKEGKSETLPLLVSDGSADQHFDLEPTDIIEGSLAISIDEGTGYEPWTEQDSLFLSTPTDKHFTTERDGEDRITIIFGDGSTGKIPAIASPIKPDVRRGGGERGNVGAETINTVVSVILFGPNPVSVSVINPEAASAGEDPMGVEEARRQGPRSFKTLDRAVTPSDFETLAEDFPGVTKARVTGKRIGEGVEGCCCGVSIAIAVEGGGAPTQALKDDLKAFLKERAMITTCIEIDAAKLVKVDVSGTIFTGSSIATDQVASAITTAINAFFAASSDAIQFGLPVFLSDLIGLLDGVTGVDHLDLSKLTRRPEAELLEWTGDRTFGTIEPGTLALDEIWTVSFITTTTFSVRGTLSGLQTNIGTVGVPYVSDSDEVTFTISVGTIPNLVGDSAQFRTSPRVANVPIDSDEVGEKGLVSFDFVTIPRPGRIC